MPAVNEVPTGAGAVPSVTEIIANWVTLAIAAKNRLAKIVDPMRARWPPSPPVNAEMIAV